MSRLSVEGMEAVYLLLDGLVQFQVRIGVQLLDVASFGLCILLGAQVLDFERGSVDPFGLDLIFLPVLIEHCFA